jgi:hypothetical protein
MGAMGATSVTADTTALAAARAGGVMRVALVAL